MISDDQVIIDPHEVETVSDRLDIGFFAGNSSTNPLPDQ
jgi:hypothetical protein